MVRVEVSVWYEVRFRLGLKEFLKRRFNLPVRKVLIRSHIISFATYGTG